MLGLGSQLDLSAHALRKEKHALVFAAHNGTIQVCAERRQRKLACVRMLGQDYFFERWAAETCATLFSVRDDSLDDHVLIRHAGWLPGAGRLLGRGLGHGGFGFGRCHIRRGNEAMQGWWAEANEPILENPLVFGALSFS